MKKPKITDGKWEVDGVKNKYVSVNNDIGDYPTPICRIVKFDQECYKVNAKSISAVPNMIDALIENIKMMEYLLSEYKRIDDIRPGDYLYLESQIKESKSALKKAGCTDD